MLLPPLICASLKGRSHRCSAFYKRTCMPAFRRGHQHHLEEGAGDSSEEEQDLWVTPVFSIPCWLGSFSLSMLLAEQSILRYSHLPDITWEACSKAVIQSKVVESSRIYTHSISNPLIKSTTWICSACINQMTKAVWCLCLMVWPFWVMNIPHFQLEVQHSFERNLVDWGQLRCLGWIRKAVLLSAPSRMAGKVPEHRALLDWEMDLP